MADDSLRIVMGPTAAGKSALILRLAEHEPLTIISADSRQLYRGFDIGTAKPTPAERARVPHRGVDVLEPEERASAATWADAARAWAAEARAGGRTPVIVGGTGFYVRALTTPLAGVDEAEPARRRSLEAWLDTLPAAELRRWCRRLDPPRAHLGRAQLQRAVEVALLTGVPLSAWHARQPQQPPARVRYLVVDPGVSLGSAIASRVDAMLAAGWEDEVAALARTVPDAAPAWHATGYTIMRQVVRGTLPRAAARELIVTRTRQYAKRQRTWLRHQLPARAVTHIDPSRSGALARLRDWWSARPEEPR